MCYKKPIERSLMTVLVIDQSSGKFLIKSDKTLESVKIVGVSVRQETLATDLAEDGLPLLQALNIGQGFIELKRGENVFLKQPLRKLVMSSSVDPCCLYFPIEIAEGWDSGKSYITFADKTQLPAEATPRALEFTWYYEVIC